MMCGYILFSFNLYRLEKWASNIDGKDEETMAYPTRATYNCLTLKSLQNSYNEN